MKLSNAYVLCISGYACVNMLMSGNRSEGYVLLATDMKSSIYPQMPYLTVLGNIAGWCHFKFWKSINQQF